MSNFVTASFVEQKLGWNSQRVSSVLVSSPSFLSSFLLFSLSFFFALSLHLWQDKLMPPRAQCVPPQDLLLKEGMAWVDDQAEEGERRFYFPSFMTAVK